MALLPVLHQRMLDLLYDEIYYFRSNLFSFGDKVELSWR